MQQPCHARRRQTCCSYTEMPFTHLFWPQLDFEHSPPNTCHRTTPHLCLKPLQRNAMQDLLQLAAIWASGERFLASTCTHQRLSHHKLLRLGSTMQPLWCFSRKPDTKAVGRATASSNPRKTRNYQPTRLKDSLISTCILWMLSRLLTRMQVLIFQVVFTAANKRLTPDVLKKESEV